MGRCSRNASLPHRLLLNGGGTFTDVASAAGLTTGSPAAACTGVALSDVNNDGAVDVVFTGPSSTRLLVNSGGGVFSDVASLWGIATSACTAAAVLNPRCHRGTLTATVLVVRTEASPGFPRAFDCASLTRIHGVVRRVTVGDDAFKPHL